MLQVNCSTPSTVKKHGNGETFWGFFVKLSGLAQMKNCEDYVFFSPKTVKFVPENKENPEWTNSPKLVRQTGPQQQEVDLNVGLVFPINHKLHAREAAVVRDTGQPHKPIALFIPNALYEEYESCLGQ